LAWALISSESLVSFSSVSSLSERHFEKGKHARIPNTSAKAGNSATGDFAVLNALCRADQSGIQNSALGILLGHLGTLIDQSLHGFALLALGILIQSFEVSSSRAT
jgi:hypothetical protein